MSKRKCSSIHTSVVNIKKYLLLSFFIIISGSDKERKHLFLKVHQLLSWHSHVHCLCPQGRQWDIVAWVPTKSQCQLRTSITYKSPVLISDFSFSALSLVLFKSNSSTIPHRGVIYVCSSLSRMWLILAKKLGTCLELPGVFSDCSTPSWISCPSQQYFSTLFGANIIHDRKIRMQT